MKRKLSAKLIVCLAAAGLGTSPLKADNECNSDYLTLGPIVQEADCKNDCVEISVSPSYQHPCADNYCTQKVYTGDGTNVVTITQTTTPGICWPSFEPSEPGTCLNQDQYATTTTFTVHQPLNFSSCDCPG